jgi:sulfide:quinone oxidoreductase
MARVVVLGSGFAGHTAALNLAKDLGSKHEVVVVTPQKKFGYIPSFVWVGIGKMKAEQCQFELAPVYKKMGIVYVNGRAVEVKPDAGEQTVIVELNDGGTETVNYDYLIVATGPKLNYAGTKGLGMDGGHSLSICTPDHAQETGEIYLDLVKKMEDGQKQKIVIGTGHGMCTCQGAAFEYIHNIAFDLEERGLSDMAEITWISNEQALGDFGVGGMVIKKGGYEVSGKIFAESSFVERGISWVTGAHTKEVRPGQLDYVTISGEEGTLDFDFSMLIPPFAGVPIKWTNKAGEDITGTICAPNGMVKVDADYESAARGYDNWKPEDWPEIYRNPTYENVYSGGIAFAPPHPISKPASAPDGTPIVATPPRTGMAAGIIGHTIAKNVASIVKGSNKPLMKNSMAEFGAACVASMGNSMTKGSAATMVMYPVVPDYDRFTTGRNNDYTFGDQGLAGHWLKVILHYMFLYKMKAKPGWWLIPD